MLLLEDFCKKSPGFRALIIWEETPSPFPVGSLIDGLPELTQQHCVLVALGYRLILLFSATGGPALPAGPFCLGVSYQSFVEILFLEVHLPRDSGPDITGPTDAQRLRARSSNSYR